MSIEEQTKLLDGILEEFRNLVNQYFPNFTVTGSGYAGPQFHITLTDRPELYANTPYYYAGELKFIHWTTIENLVSIINGGEIRLYNLINSEDEEEFNYAANALHLPIKQAEFIKNNYFTFSFCKTEDLYNEYLWETYGKKYVGVAIEFSVVNPINTWQNYFISKIYYELPDSFQVFREKIDALKAKYNNQIELDFNIWKIAGFHKTSSYKSENELRISTCLPFSHLEEELKEAKTQFRIDGKRNRIVKYIPLKLWIDWNSPYPKDFYKDEKIAEKYNLAMSGKPHLKIENIYFGSKCGLDNSEYYEYKRALEEMISFQLGYHIDLPLNLFDIRDK